MRPGKPYPATFRSFQWTHPELNWDLRHARAASSPWTMSPRFPVDLVGVEATTPTLQGSVAPDGMQARSTSAGFTRADVNSRRWHGGPRSEVRSGIEPDPRPYQGRVLPKHLQTAVSVIPGGIEPPISWVSSRRLCRWTTGSCQ